MATLDAMRRDAVADSVDRSHEHAGLSACSLSAVPDRQADTAAAASAPIAPSA